MAVSPDRATILTGQPRQDSQALGRGHRRAPRLAHRGHPDSVTSVAFSPDGKALLTGCPNGAVCKWNAASRQPIGEPIELNESVSVAAFSPDGKSILTGTTSERRGRCKRVWAWSGPVCWCAGHLSHAAFSPDGRWVLVGSQSERQCQLCDRATRWSAHRALSPPIPTGCAAWPSARWARRFSREARQDGPALGDRNPRAPAAGRSSMTGRLSAWPSARWVRRSWPVAATAPSRLGRPSRPVRRKTFV